MSLSDIAGLTERRAETLTYSEEEAALIISSIKGNVKFLGTKKPQQSLKQLEYMLRKEVNLQLHALTLGEYYKEKRIPRGLRILLRPTLCQNTVGFEEKWRKILNKCSLDLILLTITELQNSIESTSQEIEEIKGHLSKELEITTWTKSLEEINNTIAKHRAEIEAKKVRKFKRDTLDYKFNIVYTFLESQPQQRRRYQERQQGQQGSITTQTPSSSEVDSSPSSEDISITGASTSTGETQRGTHKTSFLEKRQKPGEGGGGGGPRGGETIQTRSQTQKPS